MMSLPVIILSGFLFAVAAPFISKAFGKWAKYVLVVYPLAAFIAIYSVARVPGEMVRYSAEWVPFLDVSLSFAVDGIARLFGLIISGIGALILLYTYGYLKGHPHLGRFYAFILLFMSSMLGLVLADNVFLLFIFWELTSVSSYFLIGFKTHRAEARAGALQALLVTGLGGLALLIGLILVGSIAGTFELSELASKSHLIQSHSLYIPALILVLAGAFTKSAQFPFHFWLPNAMEAPTPASAYLHSATMVKAGIFLLMKFAPVLGTTETWNTVVSLFGLATMALGAVMAYAQTDMKRILAYTTISALGTLTLLIGMDTDESMRAAVIFLMVHSLYKGALFMMTGAIDHGTKTRNIAELGGLSRVMPFTAAAAMIASLSMAGVPPLIGFIAKELLYEAKLQAPVAGDIITIVGVGSNMFVVAVAGVIAFKPFWGSLKQTPREPHEAPWQMLVGPLTLAGLGLIFGLFPNAIAGKTIDSAIVSLKPEISQVRFALWHGFNLVLLMSVATILVGIALYKLRPHALKLAAPLSRLAFIGPAKAYSSSIDRMLAVAKRLTISFQSGYLRRYVIIFALVFVVLVGFSVLRAGAPKAGDFAYSPPVVELVLALAITAGAVAAARAESRLTALVALGVVGFGVSLIFVLYSAPDLAMTQFAVETLVVVLAAVILRRLPELKTLSSPATKFRDGILAASVGLAVTLLTIAAASERVVKDISAFYANASVPLAHGRNIVNVILVDFRALDTLGEITVLAIAALGASALIRMTAKEDNLR